MKQRRKVGNPEVQVAQSFLCTSKEGNDKKLIKWNGDLITGGRGRLVIRITEVSLRFSLHRILKTLEMGEIREGKRRGKRGNFKGEDVGGLRYGERYGRCLMMKVRMRCWLMERGYNARSVELEMIFNRERWVLTLRWCSLWLHRRSYCFFSVFPRPCTGIDLSIPTKFLSLSWKCLLSVSGKVASCYWWTLTTNKWGWFDFMFLQSLLAQSHSSCAKTYQLQ